MKIEEVDQFLTELAERYDVPKPNYCIYKVTPIKRLNPFKTKTGQLRIISSAITHDYGAFFHAHGKLCYITLLIHKNGIVSRENILHEFKHYIDYVKNGYEILLDNEKRERRARSFARKGMKHYRKTREWLEA